MPTPPGKPRRRAVIAPAQPGKRSNAAVLTTKIDPEALNWITSRPEGTRAFLERLVGEDKARATAKKPAEPAGPVETQNVEVPEWDRFERGRSIKLALGEIEPVEE